MGDDFRSFINHHTRVFHSNGGTVKLRVCEKIKINLMKNCFSIIPLNYNRSNNVS